MKDLAAEEIFSDRIRLGTETRESIVKYARPGALVKLGSLEFVFL